MSETLHIYSRVSTQVQVDEGTSIQTQQEIGKQLAKQLGFKFQIWNEGGASSHHEEVHKRPKFAELLREIESGRIRHLYAWEFDRLTRNEDVSHIIRQRLYKHNVTLYLKNGKYDFADKTTRLLMGILGQFANYENSLRVERSRAGKLKRVREGFWLGGPPPYGYEIKDKKLEVNKTEAKWVKKIFDLYTRGKSTVFIRGFLMDNGVLSRRKKAIWSLGSLEALLRNTHYDGYFEYHDKHYDEKIRVQCPRIVDPEIYATTVRQLEERGYKKKNRREVTSVAEFNYMLTPFLQCKYCGSPFHGNQKKTQTSYYFCSRKYKVRNANEDESYRCSTYRNIQIDPTDKLVWSAVLEVCQNSHLFREGIKNQVFGNKKSQSEVDLRAKQIQTLMKRLDTEMDRISDSIANMSADIVMGSSPKDAEKIIRVLDKRRQDLGLQKKDLLDELHQETEKEKFVDWVLLFKDQIADLDNLEYDKRRDFLSGVLDKVVVESLDVQKHRLLVHFKFPFVGDTLTWNNPKNKRLGYVLGDGKKVKTLTANLLERRAYPVGSKRPNRTKSNEQRRREIAGK